VFTGSPSISREEATYLAAKFGIEVKAGVTKQTTHLIVGDQDLSVLGGHVKSSKHRKAEEMREAGHPIRIMGETEFKGLMSNGRAR
jgi:DNA polymerase-3 subunit epsilon